MKRIKALVFTVALVCAAGPICAQAGLAVDFTTPNVNFNNGYWCLGWTFTVDAPILVQSLGFYDDLQNGLTESHDVGIFDSTQQLIVSGTVDPGDPLGSWWRWTDVTAIWLLPGEEYTIGAVTGSENYTWEPAGIVFDPLVNFQHNSHVSAAVLTYPGSTEPLVTYGDFGPNFSVDAVGIPAPAALVLLVSGLASVVGLRRRLS